MKEHFGTVCRRDYIRTQCPLVVECDNQAKKKCIFNITNVQCNRNCQRVKPTNFIEQSPWEDDRKL